jgi:hypothetical protein
MKNRLFSLVALGALASLPGVATAQYVTYRKGDIAISPLMAGVMVSTSLPENRNLSSAAFGLFTDLDYHLTSNWAIGGLLNLGFGSNVMLLDVGPQVKYKFDAGPHHPYLRAAFTYRMRRSSFDNVDTSYTNSGLGIINFGGGYKYQPHKMVSVGIDVSFVPTEMFFDDALGGSKFVFGINIQAGVELRI